MERVVSVTVREEWTLEVVFSDGTRGKACLKDHLFGPVFEPYRDPAFFAQVSVDEFGVVCWPNGADLAPDALYEDIRRTAQVA